MRFIKRNVIILFFLTNFLVINAQTHIKITSSAGNDTISVCSGEQVYFYGFLINGNDTLNAFWQWDMDDGTIFSGQGSDTIRYSFVLEKAHRVIVRATYNDTTYSAQIIVKVGLSPFFTGTSTDLDQNQIGICKGDKVHLIGKITGPRTWIDKPTSVYTEPFPFEITDQVSYTNSITRKDFPLTDTIASGSEIDSIGLLIVHSNSADLRISLTAPGGQTIILKNTGGNQNYLGDTSAATNGARWYYWSMNATNTMNSLTISGQMIPPGKYLPEQGFSLLTGSALNGQWTIKIEDLFGQNNGYILGWAIFFNPAYVPDTLKYTCTYDFANAFWNGDNVNITSNGVADAYPNEYGPHPYKFYIKDNFGCFHDTTIGVEVEKPDFSLDKPQVVIGDSIKTEDLTSWSVLSTWDFGDTAAPATGKTVYHKYYDKGDYIITLTAQSTSGCQDQDTARVKVVPQPIDITNYNVFTPNGDGVNDIFSFFNTPEEKIIAANIETIDARIYDRYGHLVCRWTNPQQAIKGWDGTINNNGRTPAPEGVYYYIIIIKGKDGKKYKPFSGFIYLHR